MSSIATGTASISASTIRLWSWREAQFRTNYGGKDTGLATARSSSAAGGISASSTTSASPMTARCSPIPPARACRAASRQFRRLCRDRPAALAARGRRRGERHLGVQPRLVRAHPTATRSASTSTAASFSPVSFRAGRTTGSARASCMPASPTPFAPSIATPSTSADSGVVRDYETNLELTYVAQIVPGWTVQPVLTHIWHPSGDDRRNALVTGGVRSGGSDRGRRQPDLGESTCRRSFRPLNIFGSARGPSQAKFSFWLYDRSLAGSGRKQHMTRKKRTAPEGAVLCLFNSGRVSDSLREIAVQCRAFREATCCVWRRPSSPGQTHEPVPRSSSRI